MLFSNWAADSAAQDYIDRQPGAAAACGPSPKAGGADCAWAWIFFVMSLFTSLAFSVAFFLAFMERQLRYNRSLGAVRARRSRSCSRE